MAAELGISERVHFMGARRDVAERMAAAQLFLLISNWEGFPRSILEAMRARLPVVASDVGGSRESVFESETGFLIPRGDAATLTSRLRLLLSDPDLRVRMGAAGRQRYEERFVAQRMFQRTFAVYDEVLRGKATRVPVRPLPEGAHWGAEGDGVSIPAGSEGYAAPRPSLPV
jgi:glycosyltransferase involved in cell wall biosynthesis